MFTPNFPIPVVTLGPGSQTSEDTELIYQPLPTMSPRPEPRIPDSADPQSLRSAAALLTELEREWRHWTPGAAAPRLRLTRVPQAVVRTLDESLGDGDVSIVVRRGRGAEGLRLRVQETAFAGLWRVHSIPGGGKATEHALEVGTVPALVATAAARGRTTLRLAPPPAGAMNAPAVLREIIHRVRERQPGDVRHVMNLSLLPLTPEDKQYLGDSLGSGAVAFLSRGFGNCRIDSTLLRGVWRVRYFNNMETTILDCIEIGDIPEAALAAPEDMQDSVERLPELLEWMREG